MLRTGLNHAVCLCGNDKDDVCSYDFIGGWKLSLFQKIRTNFRKCLLGTNIILSDDKENAIHKSKGVIEHELLQLATVGPAPEFALEKSPPDFYFTIR